MSTTNERPTPETDAETMDGAFKEQGCTIILQQWDYYQAPDGDVVMAEVARRLERDRDEAREKLEAMRSAIKEAADALRAWPKAGSGMSTDHTLQSQAFRSGQAALAKLQPFLKP